jgi:hypothetical protein
MAKKHKFHATHIQHHKDGSHTIHHMHEDGPEHDVKGAVADHDGMMDHMMEHTAAPNPGEAQADAGDHGVPPAMAAPAGLPGLPGAGA